ncbi:TetR/AcrR family transcriptional regulator [Sphingomonas crocodyli]|uniref:TetR/AcrR family transcriptional regulator n=1 Tax=Sphingomonas crocodyli TaxID=1979270 RepID=A0A437LWE3_9SPHN|nr:TetR/AcrR family transcriptional regulator [Sphingomonas crocodyli]RVT89718.1 TetR/AcrR family transcriptional regulator [Sphingomonas crocodyli]
MGRRSDHSRDELVALILDEGQRLMAETGFARFSAREVAKRIGYSVGTIMNLFGSVDGLVLAINSRSFLLWADMLTRELDGAGANRIHALVRGYFAFAQGHRNLWSAIYEHRLPDGMVLPTDLAEQRAHLTDIVIREVAIALPALDADSAASLGRSLIATVHGHCAFALNGSFDLLGEADPLALATARVDEVLAANRAIG